jgi:hypothetical protein
MPETAVILALSFGTLFVLANLWLLRTRPADHAAINHLLAGLGWRSKCDVRFAGASGTVDSVCKLGTRTQTARSTITFTGDNAYHTETRAHFDPPLGNTADRTTISGAKWLGPCPANMQPGDIITATGIRMHLDPDATP